MQDILTRYRPLITQALIESVPEEPAYSPIRYHYGLENETGVRISDDQIILPGKLLRPTLMLLTYEGLSQTKPDIHHVLTAAVAIEHMHNFSLIHDDIEDQDRQRHGKPTLWTIEKWGEKQAINAGDLLHVLARKCLEQLEFKPDIVNDCIQLFSQTSQRLIIGQYHDMVFENRTHVTMSEYMNMISGKTSAMIELPLLLPAKLQRVNLQLYENLKNYGEILGKIFQLRDDYLGIWGENAVTGKSKDSDIQRKKKTFPIIYALEKINTDQSKLTLLDKNMFLSFYLNKQAPTVDEINKIRRYIEMTAAKEALEKEITNSYNQALEEIAKMNINERLKTDYTLLADFFVHRNH